MDSPTTRNETLRSVMNVSIVPLAVSFVVLGIAEVTLHQRSIGWQVVIQINLDREEG